MFSRQNVLNLYKSDSSIDNSSYVTLLKSNKNTLWKIFSFYCASNISIPTLSSDKMQTLKSRDSKQIVPCSDLRRLCKDWDMIPQLLTPIRLDKLTKKLFDSMPKLSPNKNFRTDTISYDQFCTLLLYISMDAVACRSERNFCFFDNESTVRPLVEITQNAMKPEDNKWISDGLKCVLTVMDRSEGRLKFSKLRTSIVVPPFIGVEGASTVSGMGIELISKDPLASRNLIFHHEKDINALHLIKRNEGILVSIALRYSVPKSPSSPPVATSSYDSFRGSYYSLLDDSKGFEPSQRDEIRKAAVNIPFDGLWSLFNDFDISPELIERPVLRCIYEHVLSQIVHSPSTAITIIVNPKDSEKGKVEPTISTQYIPVEPNVSNTNFAWDVSYHHFIDILFHAAQNCHRITGREVDTLNMESKLKTFFCMMNISSGRERLQKADRTATLIPPLHEENIKELITRQFRKEVNSLPLKYTASRASERIESVSSAPRRSSSNPPARRGGTSVDSKLQGKGAEGPRGSRVASCSTMSAVNNQNGNNISDHSDSKSSAVNVKRRSLSVTRRTSSLTPQPKFISGKEVHNIVDNKIIEHFELKITEESSLMQELKRLTILQHPSILEMQNNKVGRWCPITSKKLDVLQYCLQSAGTEAEWEEIFRWHDFILIEYLFSFMNSRVNRVLADGASRCFAYASVVYTRLWSDYLKHRETNRVLVENLQRLILTATSRLVHMSTLSANEIPVDERENNQPTTASSNAHRFSSPTKSTRPSTSFSSSASSRTIPTTPTSAARKANGSKTPPTPVSARKSNEKLSTATTPPARATNGSSASKNNLNDSTSVNITKVAKEQSPKKQLAKRSEFAVDSQTAISIWVLLLTNVFIEKPIKILFEDFIHYRNDSQDNELAKEVHNVLHGITDLLNTIPKVKNEAVNCLIVKAIIAINYQFPSKCNFGVRDVSGTEISALCTQLQYSTDNISNGVNFNLPERLLLMLNDMGYPNHTESEVIPTIKFCTDLICERKVENILYLSDRKMLFDIVLRELSNISRDELLIREAYLLLGFELLVSSGNDEKFSRNFESFYNTLMELRFDFDDAKDEINIIMIDTILNSCYPSAIA